MIAKGYTNIREMIETQYGILSHMITDIAYRYQTQLKQTEKIIDIIRLSLREYIYVVLCNKEHKLHIKFGYDYYLNVSCSLNCETLKNIVCREGLYLDPR